MKNNSWRLKKTLARRVDFRPIEDEDIKFVWAAYKKGALKDMAGPFENESMTADEFKATFVETVQQRYSGAWTMFAETRKGFMPVGVIFAFYSHRDPALSPFMIVGDLVWFPWASKRNRVESAVNFFDRIRKTIPMVDYAHGEANKRFFEMVSKHAVMRRVGTTYNVHKGGEPVAIFETRAA
jgi:hypothetical protein